MHDRLSHDADHALQRLIPDLVGCPRLELRELYLSTNKFAGPLPAAMQLMLSVSTLS